MKSYSRSDDHWAINPWEAGPMVFKLHHFLIFFAWFRTEKCKASNQFLTSKVFFWMRIYLLVPIFLVSCRLILQKYWLYTLTYFVWKYIVIVLSIAADICSMHFMNKMNTVELFLAWKNQQYRLSRDLNLALGVIFQTFFTKFRRICYIVMI